MKTSFRAYSSALWRPIRVTIRGFIRNPQAVLLLAACRTPKSDRLLGVEEMFPEPCCKLSGGDARLRCVWYGSRFADPVMDRRGVLLGQFQ